MLVYSDCSIGFTQLALPVSRGYQTQREYYQGLPRNWIIGFRDVYKQLTHCFIVFQFFSSTWQRQNTRILNDSWPYTDDSLWENMANKCIYRYVNLLYFKYSSLIHYISFKEHLLEGNIFFLFLKCLLASCLPLFRLSTLLWFGSCNHCIAACFFWSKNCEHQSSYHSPHCFNSYRPRLSLAEVLMFSLMFSQALFMSLLSFKFSKAANLFENLNQIPIPNPHLT